MKHRRTISAVIAIAIALVASTFLCPWCAVTGEKVGVIIVLGVIEAVFVRKGW